MLSRDIAPRQFARVGLVGKAQCVHDVARKAGHLGDVGLVSYLLDALSPNRDRRPVSETAPISPNSQSSTIGDTFPIPNDCSKSRQSKAELARENVRQELFCVQSELVGQVQHRQFAYVVPEVTPRRHEEADCSRDRAGTFEQIPSVRASQQGADDRRTDSQQNSRSSAGPKTPRRAQISHTSIIGTFVAGPDRHSLLPMVSRLALRGMGLGTGWDGLTAPAQVIKDAEFHPPLAWRSPMALRPPYHMAVRAPLTRSRRFSAAGRGPRPAGGPSASRRRRGCAFANPTSRRPWRERAAPCRPDAAPARGRNRAAPAP